MSAQRILCVHDRAKELQELRGTLERAGYDVVPAKDGSEAMHALNAGDVDGVVLDFNLKAPGGVTLRTRISHAFPEMPLLLFSHVDEIKRMPLSVFEAYLHNPGPPETLLSLISTN